VNTWSFWARESFRTLKFFISKHLSPPKDLCGIVPPNLVARCKPDFLAMVPRMVRQISDYPPLLFAGADCIIGPWQDRGVALLLHCIDFLRQFA
jgi:hypothetical protein